MSNIQLNSGQETEKLLRALGEQLAEGGGHYTPSEGYRVVLRRVLAHLGAGDGTAEP